MSNIDKNSQTLAEQVVVDLREEVLYVDGVCFPWLISSEFDFERCFEDLSGDGFGIAWIPVLTESYQVKQREDDSE